MNVNVQKDGAKLTLGVEGKLSTNTAPALEKAMKENVDGVTELIFDFEKLDYMASAGLRKKASAAAASVTTGGNGTFQEYKYKES